jgi:hypothetical protein
MGQQLFFKKPLQVAIREGRKRTTIRRWKDARLRHGDRSYAPGVGWLAIDAVEAVDLDRLAEADARADGFDTLHTLRQALLALSPDHATDGLRWFRVSFTLDAAATVSRRSKRLRQRKQLSFFPDLPADRT